MPHTPGRAHDPGSSDCHQRADLFRAPGSWIWHSVAVVRPRSGSDDSDDSLLALFGAISARDHSGVAQRLDQVPGLVTLPLRVGASRQNPRPYFLDRIGHYLYAGDTALHVAAAANDRGQAESLVERGAAVRAHNRRGAEPLHYAADGGPGAHSNAQRELITFLIDAGADPNALDKSGVAPLHRAVRDRCASGVSALIDKGANPLLLNKSGLTPLHLAVQNTGKSHSGSDAAKQEQYRVIVFLLDHGASPNDVDAKGKTVADTAISEWIRELLNSY